MRSLVNKNYIGENLLVNLRNFGCIQNNVEGNKASMGCFPKLFTEMKQQSTSSCERGVLTVP